MTNVETLSQILQHKQDELRSILNNPHPDFHARRKHLRMMVESLREQIEFIQENQFTLIRDDSSNSRGQG